MTEQEVQDASKTLQEEIDEFYVEISKQAPEALLSGIKKSVQDVTQTGIAERSLGVGATMPEFTLPNATGKPIALTDLLKDGPLS